MPLKIDPELVLAAALIGALGFSSPAWGQDPPVSAHVELVADSLPTDTRAAVEVELDGQLAAAVDELRLIVVESESAELFVRVEIGQPNPKAPVYVVHSVALYDGDVLERGDARTCLRCTAAELVGAGLAILPKAAARALVARDEVDGGEASVRQSGAGRGPRAMPPGPAGYVGFALGSLGLVGAVAGGVLLDRDDLRVG
ncbi:hypothetical protein, partial [Enhygromyxa salina]|uniref:hypothetical protein n=1 Tax=Enhygromyxa salina TaxID=215803 RepID=UPI0011B28DCA